MASGSDDTPLMKQFWEIKSQAGDALLFFRMGDFYELFGDDAVEAAKILEITLTSRDKNKANPLPMAGVPHHSVQGYIQKLLACGKKVAIGEQMEDPAASKAAGSKIVKRELTRIFTPAVNFDVEGSQALYLACAVRAEKDWSLACLDVSTGEALTASGLDAASLAVELQSLPIRHVLRINKLEIPALGPEVLVEDLPSNYLAEDQALKTLLRHYDVGQLDAFLPNNAAVFALGLLVTYALRTQQKEKLAHLRTCDCPLQFAKTMLSF
jgi:DNA mismatch repair protein MutS